MCAGWFAVLDAAIWATASDECLAMLSELVSGVDARLEVPSRLAAWWRNKGVRSLTEAQLWFRAQNSSATTLASDRLSPRRPLPHLLRLAVMRETGIEADLHGVFAHALGLRPTRSSGPGSVQRSGAMGRSVSLRLEELTEALQGAWN